MNDQASENASARIERALVRIEAASGHSRAGHADLARRHAALRDRIGEAIASLDSLIARDGDD